MRKIEYQKMIYRKDLKENPDKIYLFGDNLARVGMGGQAREMRGEPNAIGIPTKKSPYANAESYMTDDEYIENVMAIDAALSIIPKKCVLVIPEDGLGTGLARLEDFAPLTYQYLQKNMTELEIKPIQPNIYRLTRIEYPVCPDKDKDKLKIIGFYSSKKKCWSHVEEYCKKQFDDIVVEIHASSHDIKVDEKKYIPEHSIHVSDLEDLFVAYFIVDRLIIN